MSKKQIFDQLIMSDRWVKYFKNYAQGVTVVEQLIHWVSMVNNLTDNVNSWNEYLDNFVKTFDDELKEEVITAIEKLYNDGLISDLINQFVNTKTEEINTFIEQTNLSLLELKEELNLQNETLKEELNLQNETLKEELNLQNETLKEEFEQKIVTTNNILDHINKKINYPYYIPKLKEEYKNNMHVQDINYVYAKYDELVQNGFLKKSLIGYGSNSLGSEDIGLPIYLYSNIVKEENKKLIILASGIHGNEKKGVYSLLTFIEDIFENKNDKMKKVINEYEINILPILNPYGFNNSLNINEDQRRNNIGRLNARGINLNRNFEYGFDPSINNSGSEYNSETETKAINQYLESVKNRQIELFIDIHTMFNVGDKDHSILTLAYTNDGLKLSNKLSFENEKIIKDKYDFVIEQNSEYIQDQSTFGFGMLTDVVGYKLNDFRNIFLLEGGKEKNINGETIFNDEIQTNILINQLHLLLSNFTDKKDVDTDLTYQELDIKSYEKWYNGILEVGKTYDELKFVNNRLTLIEPIINKVGVKYKIFINNDDYLFQINTLNKETKIFEKYGTWYNKIEFYYSDDTKIYTITLKRKDDKRLSKYDVLYDVGIIVIEELTSNGLYTPNISSDNITIQDVKIYKVGRINTIHFEGVSNKQINIGDTIIKNLPKAYGINQMGSVVFQGSTNSVLNPTVYTFILKNETEIASSQLIETNKAIRFTFSYITKLE